MILKSKSHNITVSQFPSLKMGFIVYIYQYNTVLVKRIGKAIEGKSSFISWHIGGTLLNKLITENDDKSPNYRSHL